MSVHELKRPPIADTKEWQVSARPANAATLAEPGHTEWQDDLTVLGATRTDLARRIQTEQRMTSTDFILQDAFYFGTAR